MGNCILTIKLCGERGTQWQVEDLGFESRVECMPIAEQSTPEYVLGTEDARYGNRSYRTLHN